MPPRRLLVEAVDQAAAVQPVEAVDQVAAHLPLDLKTGQVLASGSISGRAEGNGKIGKRLEFTIRPSSSPSMLEPSANSTQLEQGGTPLNLPVSGQSSETVPAEEH